MRRCWPDQGVHQTQFGGSADRHSHVILTIKVKPIAILTSPIGYSSHHTSHYFPNTPSSPLLLQPSTMQRWSQGHNFRAQSHSQVHSQSASRPRLWPRGLSATTYHILKYFLKFIISILSQTIFHNAINYP